MVELARPAPPSPWLDVSKARRDGAGPSTAFDRWWSRPGPRPRPLATLDAAPPLVRGRDAGPQDHRGAVGRVVAADVQAQTGLAVADGAVAVEGPLLVGGAGAAPDLELGSVHRAGRRV